MARTEPSAYLAQAKLATQTSWGGHLGPSLDPPPVPSPGTGGGKGHQNGAEETFTWWTQVLAVSESPCDMAKSGILLGHMRIRSLESTICTYPHTHGVHSRGLTHSISTWILSTKLPTPTPHLPTCSFLNRKLIFRYL